MAGKRFRGAAFLIGGSKEKGAVLGEELWEKRMVGDANADGIEMIIVEMMEIGVFR